MKIKRFGTEIELTPAEVESAYREYRLEMMVVDVEADLKMREAEVCHDIAEIAADAIHNLGKNDSYSEAFNESVSHTVGKYVERTNEIRETAEDDAENNFDEGIEVPADFHLSVMHEYGYSEREVEYYTKCYHERYNSLVSKE